MTNSPLTQKQKIYTFAQALLSGLGFLITLTGAAGAVFLAVFTAAATPEDLASAGMLFGVAWVSAAAVLLFGYGLLQAIYRLLGKAIPQIPKRWKKPSIIILGIATVLGLILMLAGLRYPLLGFIGSPAVIPMILIPLMLFVFIGGRRLSTGNTFRFWGGISFNLSVTMQTIMMLELLFFALIFIVFAVIMSGNQAFLAEITAFQSQYLSVETMDMAFLTEFAEEYLLTPQVFAGIILAVAILVPLMEELLKPMGLWFLAGKKLTPAQGFVGGMIAGACFAFLETGLALGAPVDLAWFGLYFARIGTGLLHVTCSGLVGWGVASIFYNGNWLRGIGNYLLAVLIHGLWNMFAIVSGTQEFFFSTDAAGPVMQILGDAGNFVLVFLALANLGILFFVNRKLKGQLAPPLTEII